MVPKIRPVIAGAAAALMLAGCGQAGDEVPASGTPGTRVSTPTGASRGPSLADDALLAAASMPVWNGVVKWRAVAGPATGSALTLCPVPTAGAIRAADEVSRDYVWPAGDMHGLDVVWRFESPESAAEAAGTVEQLLRECTNDTSITRVDDASTWTTSAPIDLGVSNDARFEFIGVARVGSYVTVIGFSLTGQDANWESDPILDSLRASQDHLRTRA